MSEKLPKPIAKKILSIFIIGIIITIVLVIIYWNILIFFGGLFILLGIGMFLKNKYLKMNLIVDLSGTEITLWAKDEETMKLLCIDIDYILSTLNQPNLNLKFKKKFSNGIIEGYNIVSISKPNTTKGGYDVELILVN